MPAGKYIGDRLPLAVDVASTLEKSVFPLTPPLTPASPYPAGSQTRSLRPNSIYVSESHPYAHQSYPASQSRASENFSPNRKVSEYEHVLPEFEVSDSSISPSSTFPRPQPYSINRDQELEPRCDIQCASRFLFVSGISKTASPESLNQAFETCGDLKSILVRFQAEHGAVVLSFYDARHTIRAHRLISARNFFDYVDLASYLIPADELRQLLGESNFIDSNNGQLRVSLSPLESGGDLDATTLQNVLASVGDIRAFRLMDTHALAFCVEYFDLRDALSALKTLNNSVIRGVRLHLTLSDAEARIDEQVLFPCGALSTSVAPFTSPIKDAATGIQFPYAPSPPPLDDPLFDSSRQMTRRPRLGLQRSISDLGLRAKTSEAQAEQMDQPRTNTPPQPVRGRRLSNTYDFDSVGEVTLPSTPPRPRSLSISSDTTSPAPGCMVILPDVEPLVASVGDYDPEQVSPWSSDPELWPYPHEHENMHVTSPSDQLYMDRAPWPLMQMPEGVTQLPMPTHTETRPKPTCDAPPESNRIDIARIETGEDVRTTVMIKNIPNKMSDRHLINFINNVCPRKIDFLYLRMDFMNECNVGYAFVNFIHVEDLLHFANTKLGTKWNLFSSEKVLGMSYANYQGKQALVNKFRSSSIMDERESWRPKLFYSSGTKTGLPEEFPAPIRISRKECSNALPSEPHKGRVLFHHPPGLRV